MAATALSTACKGLGDITSPKPVETPVGSVVLSIEQFSLSEGATLALQATPRDEADRAISDRRVFWSSSDTTVATVSSAGLVAAVKTGSATIAASVDGKSATARVTVTARGVASVQLTPTAPSLLVGGFVQLSARTLDESGATLLNRNVFWGSSDAKVAVVDVTGLVTGIAPGVATVTATSESRSAAVGVTVSEVPISTVQLTPTRDSVVLGQATQLTASPRDSTGALLNGRLITWTSSASAIATVSSSGLVLGISPGIITITASSGGKSNTAVITVKARPVGAVIVSPAQSALTIGQSVQLSVQITDGSGNLLTGRPISYSSSNVNVAQVSSDGKVTVSAPGAATITVTSEGKVGTASITVAPSPIADLRVTPSTFGLVVGGSTRLTANAFDAGGNPLAQRSVTWTSGAPSVVSVISDGTVNAVGPGTAIVFAAAEGKLATSTILVQSIIPATVVVLPAVSTIIAGESQDLTATLRDAAGQPITGRVVQWSSSNPAVAIVSSAGRVRGVAPGGVRIDATVDGVTGSSNITVNPVPIATVTVSLASPTVIVGLTTQASATARDANGGVLTGRAVTWASSNTAVATVSTTGVVTAVSLGGAIIRASSEGVTGGATMTAVAGAPTTIAANSVTTQSTTAGTVVAAPPSVKVTDASGTAVAGVSVVFTVTGGGGTTSPASPATVVTNASGIATLTSWTLGTTAGANAVTATVTGLTGSPVTFAATGAIGAPTTIASNSVTTQSTTIGTAVSVAPSVKVTDAGGNPVSGATVVFTITSGAGTLSPASPATVTTNASGIVTVTSWTLGVTAGANTLTVTATGLTGSPVTFTATGTVGSPTTIAANSVTTQSATAGTSVATPPSVKVTDAGGNPVTGVSVAFSVFSGGGSMAPLTVATNASGIATVTSWTLGNVAGANSVRATVSGLAGSPVTFSATGTVGVATSLVANSVTTQSATVSAAVTTPPSVKVTDAVGNGVSGVSVTFTLVSGNGTLSPASPATVVTNASGIATLTTWTLGAAAGANSVSAAASGLAGSPITFNATGTVGTPTAVSANSVTTQSATAGSAASAPPSVRVTDAGGNPVSGVSVVFAMTAGGGVLSPVSPATVATNASGIATLTSWTLGTTAGVNTVTATVTGLTGSPVTFSATGTAGVATTLIANSLAAQSATVSTAVAAPPSVKVTDANGNGVGGASVVFTLTAGGGAMTPATPATIVTNAGGVATLTTWTVGASAGTNTITAAATGLTGSPVTFNATGTVGTPTTIAANSVTTQTATAGTAVAAPPSVKVTDVGGNPVSGVSVAFSVFTGGGTVLPAAVSTNASGIATLTSWTLGSVAGANSVRATVTGLTGSPVTFNATGTVGAAAAIISNSVTTQSATSSSAVTAPPSVKVTDAVGNGVIGVSVVFTVTAGVGTISPASPATIVTNASGIATLTTWTLGASAGTNTLTAAATGLTGSPVTFTATATVGTPMTIASISMTTQSATAGTTVTTPPSVRVTDAGGNPVSGVTVAFAVATGGGSVTPVTVSTNASGIATLTSWTLGNTAGPNSVSATVSGLAGSPVTFNATGTIGAASILVAQSATSQSSTISSAVSAPPSVKVTDAAGNGVSGVSVVFTLASGGGSISPASPATIVTNASGIATLTSWTLGVAAGANSVTAASAGLTGSPITFAATGTVGTATAIASNSVTTQSATAGTVVATPPSVRVTDVGGNPVSGVSVVFTTTTGAGALSPASPATVLTNASGIATLTSWTLGTVAGTNTLTASSSGLTGSPVTFSATGIAGTAAQLAVTTQPSGAVNAITFTTQPVVDIRDVNGNRTTSTASVTVSIASGSGALSGTTTVAAVNGTATFTNLVITGTGAHTLQFATTSPALSVSSSSFTVTAGTPTQLVVNTQPAGAVSGVVFTTQPVIQIRDANNALTTSTASVTAGIASGTGALSGTTTVAAVNGVATFTDLKISGSGAHTLTFTSTGLTSVTSSSITVTQTAASLSVKTQPAGATTGIAFTTQPVVRILDQGGVIVTTGTGASEVVTASVATGTGALGGTLTATAINGVATFTNLQITGTGAQTLQFATTTPTLTTTSSSFTVTAGTPTQVAITTQPAGAVSGVAFTTQPVIQLRDAGGNLTTSTANVTVVIASGTGTLTGTATVAAVNGVATFTNLQIAGAGAHSLTFASAGLTSATSSSFTVTQAAASLSVQTQPAGATTGVAFTTQPVVRILDQGSVVVTTGTGASLVVTVSIASGTGTLGGTVTATAVNGVATFTNLQITGTGAHTLQFATTTPTLSTTSSSVTVAAGTPTQVAITTQPAGAVSGVVFTTQPVVQLRDAGGNLTASTANVTVAIASGTGALTGTATVAAINGVATFTNLKIAGAGAHTLTLTSAGLTAATSSSFTVTQSAASLSMQVQPTGAVTGIAFTTQPVVRILDQGGVVVTTGTDASLVVTAAIASGTGTLGGTSTATAVNGVATFANLQITGTGAHTLQFTTASPALSVTSASVTVAAGSATQVALTTQPSGAVSGVAFTTQPVVQLRDAGGNLTSSTASVTVTISSGTGILSGTTTVNAVNGVVTFTNLKIAGSGSHRLTFSSGVLTSATSSSFSVTQSGSSLSVSTQPAGASSGVAFVTQPEIQILDDAGLVVTTGTNASLVVTAAMASGNGTLSGTLTATAVNGVATFTNLAIIGSGVQTLQFSTSSPSLTTTSASFSIGAGAATQLALTTQPAGAVSGVAFTTQPAVDIRDAGNNLTSSTANVMVAIASGTGTLTGTTTVAAINGVATFTNLKIAGAGAHSLTFTSSGLTSATSSSFTVTQTAASLSISTAPSGASSGVAFTTQPTIQILDNAGLVVTTGAGASLMVTAAKGSGTGTLSGTLTATAVNGVATFTNLTITGSGTHTLQFTTSAPSLTTTSGSISLGAGAASQLAIATQPSGAVSGVVFTTQPAIEIRDASNNLTSSTANVTAAIASGGGVLSGTTMVAAVNGVATFTNLQIAGTGVHTLTFTSSGLTSATSNSITVTQTAASLSVTTQPAGATSGTAFTAQPAVQILDNAGLPVTTGAGATLVVTAAQASGNGTLSGTLTATAVNGVATFANLSMTGSGAQTLQFTTSSPLLTATSSSFSIAAGAPTQLAIGAQPAGAVSGVTFTTQPSIEIRDAGGNLTTSTAAVTVAIASGSGALFGTLTVNAINGVATFTNLQINGPGAHTLTFTAGALTAATSASFTVTQIAAALSVQTPPNGATSGNAFTTQPIVQILDNAGMPVTTGAGATLVVTAAVGTGTGTLGGTLTATASNGVATFTNLAITGTGAHTLTFTTTSPALTVTSASFTVGALDFFGGSALAMHRATTDSTHRMFSLGTRVSAVTQ